MWGHLYRRSPPQGSPGSVQCPCSAVDRICAVVCCVPVCWYKQGPKSSSTSSKFLFGTLKKIGFLTSALSRRNPLGWTQDPWLAAGLQVRLAFCQVGSGEQGQLLVGGEGGGGDICSDFGPRLGTGCGWAQEQGGAVAPVQARDAKVCGEQQSEDPE